MTQYASLELRLDPIPVTRADAENAIAEAVRRFGPGPDIARSAIPRTKAFFRALTPDDAGRLWVRVGAPWTRGTL